jgi:hypothetical protein
MAKRPQDIYLLGMSLPLSTLLSVGWLVLGSKLKAKRKPRLAASTRPNPPCQPPRYFPSTSMAFSMYLGRDWQDGPQARDCRRAGVGNLTATRGWLDESKETLARHS